MVSAHEPLGTGQYVCSIDQMVFDPKDATLTVTKIAAASRQVEAAIDATERGDFDIAITLAGAAEGMLPELPHQPLFSLMRDNPKVPDSVSRKAWIAALNGERDWLKHETNWMGDQIEIELPDATFMLLRALAKLPEWTPKMWAFKTWAVENDFQPPRDGE